MPEPTSNQSESAGMNYAALVSFLVQPFLDSPDSLKVDCEASPSRPRIWIRLAFEGEEKGRVFGRGGRNIQAIRTVLEASAKANGQSIYLDIYGGQATGRDTVAPSRPPTGGHPKPPSRPPTSFPKTSSRLQSRGPN